MDATPLEPDYWTPERLMGKYIPTVEERISKGGLLSEHSYPSNGEHIRQPIKTTIANCRELDEGGRLISSQPVVMLVDGEVSWSKREYAGGYSTSTEDE